MFRHIIISFLTVMALSGALFAEEMPMPESQLLLPYFEVSLEGFDRMTFFSIVNASDEPIDLTAQVYSNWAVPMLEVEIRLESKEVRQIDLHSWLVSGKTSSEEFLCPGGASDCMDLLHLQKALAGEASPMTQYYYSSELKSGVMTGFITIKADRGFLPESDVLWGDYFYTDPVENFAQGQRLSRLEPDLACADLCVRHSIRFLEGGGFNGGTMLTIWNWDGVEREPSEFPTPQFELEKAQVNAFNQKGEHVDTMGLQVLPVQTIEVSELDVRQDFGWLDLSTFHPSAISAYYRALGRFSVGVPAWCLPCDPCNAEGSCYEPGNPSCNPDACLSARLLLQGNRVGTVGEAFYLSYDVTGSGPITIDVSDLPAGLVHRGNVIEGIPSETGSFTIFASNDCSDRSVTVEIKGSTPKTYLTLIKEVINDDDGTRTAADFPLYIGNQRVTSGERNEVLPGTYQASEDNLFPEDYAELGWSGDCAANGNVTLAEGDDKTCIVKNDDIPTPFEPPAYLTLIKIVDNSDGGTATESDFNLYVGNTQVASRERREFSAGTYRASEDNLPGYIAGEWSGDCSANGFVTLAPNDDKTCTITNTYEDEDPTYLTLIKKVTNDDGGTATVSDFTLYIDGQRVTSGQKTLVLPGAHIATEANLPGYTASAWGRDCAANGTITLAEGDDKVCEITNDDQPATVTLIKRVINDDGGTARVGDFDLFVGGRQVTSGTATQMDPGTYTVRENNLPGYTAGSWSGDCSAGGSLTLALGEHKVCEITNNDQPTTLKLIKHVINDHGGTATVGDFDLFIGSQQVTSGVAVEVAPGTYSVRENNLSGYEAGSWGRDCTSDGRVTLALGEHKVCEITNDDRPARIKLIKHVINDHGGTARVSDFALFVGSQQVTSGVALEVAAGTYTVRENNLPGYEAGAWRGDCSASGSVSVNLGELKVCEITNDDEEPACDPDPSFSIWDGEVEYNDPHTNYHHTEVSYRYRVEGEVDGEVQIFWKNGNNTYVKKRRSIDRDCEDGVTEGRLFWESNGKSHHPGHGARYFARLVVDGTVVESIPLN